MAIDLLNTVQKNLGYPELKKIDPNTQEIKKENNTPDKDRLGQAIIPAVLAGLYKLAKTEQGIQQIAGEGSVSNWADAMFAENKQEVLKNIADYTYYDMQSAELAMNDAAAETVKLIQQNTAKADNYTEMKNFIAGQRNNILPFLPAALHIGNLLEDTTIDDRTNKMEGPLSSLMHKIESGFSGHETQEEADRKSKTF